MKNSRINREASVNKEWIADAASLSLIEIDLKNKTVLLNKYALELFEQDTENVPLDEILKKLVKPDEFIKFLSGIDNSGSLTDISVFSGYRLLFFDINAKKISKLLYQVVFVPLISNIDNELDYFKEYALNTNEVFALWSKDYQILYVSPKFESVFERNRNELDNNPFSVMKWVHPDDAQMLLKNTRENNELDSEQFDVEFRIILPDGSDKWIWYRRKTIRNDKDEIYRYLSLIADIDKRKRDEKLLLYRNEFEKFLFAVSTRFIELQYDKIDLNIDSTIQEICTFTGSDSVFIYILDEKHKFAKREHYFTSLPELKENKTFDAIEINKSSKYYELLQAHYPVKINLINDENVDDEIRRKFKMFGAESFLNIGLFFQNKLIGFFGLSSGNAKKTWTDDEVKLLQIIGDIFINAVLRKNSYKSLYESEQAYREIYNSSTDAIIIHNADTRKVRDVNQATLEMFGYTYDEALKLEPIDLIFNDRKLNGNRVLEVIREALIEPKLLEFRCKTKTGKPFWVEISFKKTEIHGEMCIMAILRNIEYRKETEELLRQNEEKYRMIVEGQNELIVKFDLEGQYLFVSPSYCKLFDKKEEELIGRKFIPVIHDEDREATQLAMENLYKPPFSCYIEQRVKTKKGWRWLAWSDTAVLDSNDAVKEIIGVGRDITYQKMVENALRESEEQFRSIVQNLSDVVFLLDQKAVVKYVTPSCSEYLGLMVEELLGKKILDLVHPDDKWLAEANINAHLQGKNYIVPYELKMQHVSSTWKIFEVKSQNMLNHPAVKSIIFTISDITDRKIMEKQVLDAIIKTEEKERERFAKDLHDDLGPLLSSLKLYIGMLEKTGTKEKKEYIINNLNEIIKEAISTTKEVSNDLNPHVLNNYGLVSAIELFVEKVSTQIAINFTQNIENSRFAPAIELSLYRISKELINNTIKHAGATKIDLSINEKNGRLNLYYEDDGKGIDDSALKGKNSGGMGLSNIISRAKSLNGSYNFHVNLNHGFKFDLTLPLIQE